MAIDLNSLVALSSGYLTLGLGINDQGQIIAKDSNGFVNLLTPVPVPAAIWLFGSSLLGLTAIVRKRKDIAL